MDAATNDPEPSRGWRSLFFHPLFVGSVATLLIVVAVFSEGRTRWSATAIFAVLYVLSAIRFLTLTGRVSRALDDVERLRDRAWSPQLEAERVLLRQGLNAADVYRSPSFVPATAAASSGAGGNVLYLRGIELNNIRCFRQFGVSFESEIGPYLTTILLGDNAAGKTTVLRSIALALCPESDAISLMRSLSGSFLRDGASVGSIKVYLRSEDRHIEGSITMTVERSKQGEVIRQVVQPVSLPFEQIFVCGYGTQRTSGRPSSHERYFAKDAVATLFSDSADLLNPEVVLLRRDAATRQRLARMLGQILLLEDSDRTIHGSDRGVELEGPWGSQPLAVVSDGYRSTSQWVLDYLGWQIFANRLHDSRIDGVLLIDELEQHLHPRWQRYFVQRLRAQLDRTQIIASSHTPLLAAGVADLERSQIIRLMPTTDRSVEALRIPPEELTGKRADQVLADAFGLVTSKSPGSVSKIERMTELMTEGPNRGAAGDQELKQLHKELEDSWSAGDNKMMRVAEKAVSKVLDEMIDEGMKDMSAPVKQRLVDLFGRKDER